jgi:hypothetical protein
VQHALNRFQYYSLRKDQAAITESQLLLLAIARVQPSYKDSVGELLPAVEIAQQVVDGLVILVRFPCLLRPQSNVVGATGALNRSHVLCAAHRSAGASLASVMSRSLLCSCAQPACSHNCHEETHQRRRAGRRCALHGGACLHQGQEGQQGRHEEDSLIPSAARDVTLCRHHYGSEMLGTAHLSAPWVHAMSVTCLPCTIVRQPPRRACHLVADFMVLCSFLLSASEHRLAAQS